MKKIIGFLTLVLSLGSLQLNGKQTQIANNSHFDVEVSFTFTQEGNVAPQKRRLNKHATKLITHDGIVTIRIILAKGPELSQSIIQSLKINPIAAIVVLSSAFMKFEWILCYAFSAYGITNGRKDLITRVDIPVS